MSPCKKPKTIMFLFLALLNILSGITCLDLTGADLANDTFVNDVSQNSSVPRDESSNGVTPTAELLNNSTPSDYFLNSRMLIDAMLNNSTSSDASLSDVLPSVDILIRFIKSNDSLNNTMLNVDLLNHSISRDDLLNSSTPIDSLLNSVIQNFELLNSPITSDGSLVNTVPSNGMMNSTVQSTDLLNSTTPSANHDILYGKHESLRECPLIDLYPGDYELFPNGTLYVEVYDKMLLNESFYCFINDVIHVCPPELLDLVPEEDQPFMWMTSIMTQILLFISMICLFLHIVVFIVVPDLRNLPGWNLAALCLCLFFSYLFLTIIGKIQEEEDICLAVALLSHFFFMSSFLWMSIMSFDIFMSLLRVTGNLRVSNTQFKLKKFGIYSFCAFGCAFVFTLISFLADVLLPVPPSYRPEFRKICWFNNKKSLLIFFSAPVIVLTCLNFLFFLCSSYTIYANKMKCGQDKHKSMLRKNYLMYFRLSVIMGVTWVVGIVAAIAHTDWLWVLFVISNTLQGLFIFLAFTCSTKVKKFLRKKVLGDRMTSQQTLSPTFQSYCFYANSIEKDLDKIVDYKTKDSTDQTEHIVIHL